MRVKRERMLFIPTILLVLFGCACGGGPGDGGDDHTTAVTMVTPPALVAQQASPTPTPPDQCLAALSSVRGSVPFGDKACSPDKMLYAREEEPRNLGHIGLYERVTDKQLKAVKVAQQGEDEGDESPNELKGLAWSPDSRLLAVMYHKGGGGFVSILDVKRGAETERLGLKGQPHSIEFISQTQVRAGDETLEIR